MKFFFSLHMKFFLWIVIIVVFTVGKVTLTCANLDQSRLKMWISFSPTHVITKPSTSTCINEYVMSRYQWSSVGGGGRGARVRCSDIVE